MRACCRCENLVFVLFSLFLTLRGRSAVRYRGIQFEQALRCCLLADFKEVYTVILRRDSSFRRTANISFPSSGGATNFEKFRSEIAISPKIGEKVWAQHFV